MRPRLPDPAFTRILRASRTLARAGGVLLLASAASGATTRHTVTLADGTVVETSTRPVLALGKVSYIDASGQLATLPVSAIDLAATRAGLSPTAAGTAPRVWDQAALQRLRTPVQVVGAAIPATSDGTGDMGMEQPARAAADDGADAARRGAIERLRKEMATVQGQLSAQGERDPAIPGLLMRQRELQGELARVLGSP